MEITRQLFQQTATILSELLKFVGPADAGLQLFFKKNPKLGAKERKIMADLIFSVMRHLGTLREIAGTDPSALLLAALYQYEAVPFREEALKNLVPAELLAKISEKYQGDNLDLPEWLVAMLSASLSPEKLHQFAATVNSPAPLDLRVNTMALKREEARDILARDGFMATLSPLSPFGLRLSGKRSISRLDIYNQGQVEIQDEGSQLLALLMEAGRNDVVTDFCAGAGGKTLLMGMMMRGKGRIYALDVEEKRLSQLAPRASRAGLSNIHTMRIKDENDPNLARLYGKIDKVLVDAPCSGTGTIRRNPDLKWRRQPQDIAELATKQAAILEAASRLCKNGGRLVYATCSVLPAEDEEIVTSFLAAHPEFSLLPAQDILTRQKVALTLDTPYLRLWPQEHNTDGFFGAVLVKNG